MTTKRKKRIFDSTKSNQKKNSIWQATFKGEEVAVKMLSDETEMKLDTKQFMNEARLMSTIPRHPNVIKLVGFSKNPIAIVTGTTASFNNGNK